MCGSDSWVGEDGYGYGHWMALRWLGIQWVKVEDGNTMKGKLWWAWQGDWGGGWVAKRMMVAMKGGTSRWLSGCGVTTKLEVADPRKGEVLGLFFFFFSFFFLVFAFSRILRKYFFLLKFNQIHFPLYFLISMKMKTRNT